MSLDSLSYCEPTSPQYLLYRIVKVVPNQKSKFESDDLFRKLSQKSEIRYTAHLDLPQEERILHFQNGCLEGHMEIAFIGTGTNLQLVFQPGSLPGEQTGAERQCDFQKELGKVYVLSSFTMNGVCVRYRGWMDLQRLDGVGCLEYDEHRASQEDAILREHMDRYNQQYREYVDRQRVGRCHGTGLGTGMSTGRPGENKASYYRGQNIMHTLPRRPT